MSAVLAVDRQMSPPVRGVHRAVGTVEEVAVARPVRPREEFLDNIRAIALVRVVVWHTLAAAVISWFFASMPTMFFIAGSLLAHSLDYRPALTVLRSRLRRLLVPFWVFSAVVLSVLAIVYRMSPSANTELSFPAILPWLLPLVDPHGSAWEAGWASTPLWYLRCYLWLLLLSPVMRLLHRKIGLKALIVPLVGVFVVDYLNRNADLAPAGWDSVVWYLGDLCTYSFFWMLGFSHRDGLIAQFSRRARVEWALIGGAAALIWVKIVSVPGLVVNDSYPLLLFMGIAWLGLFLAAEQWIASMSRHQLAGPILRWLRRRAVTVYLWHPIAIVGAYWVRAEVVPDLPRLMVLPLVGVFTVVFCVMFGRAEDYAAGRPGQWWPGRPDPAGTAQIFTLAAERLRRTMSSAQALGLGVVAGVVVIAFVIPSGASGVTTVDAEKASTGDSLALPPAPSGKPDVADFAAPAEPVATTAPLAAAAQPTATASATAPAVGGANVAMTVKVRAAVDAWLTQKKVSGARIGLSLADGSQVVLASGDTDDGVALDADTAYPITSVTKSMTAAIILQLAEEGRMSIDDKLPVLTAVPDLPFAGKVTIRQVLNHTAGIMPYDRSAAYAAARSQPLTAQSALQLITTEPLEWAPGSQVGYSNSGYLALGLLAEQVSGKTYEELISSRVFTPAGMTSSTLNTTPTAGWAGFSAGGVTSTIRDQLAWGDALYRSRSILKPDPLAEMLDVENKFSTGLGAFPTCPCSMAGGKRVYSSIGHNGGQTTIQYAPAENLVMAVSVTESLWTAELSMKDLAELLVSLRKVVAGA